jgi:hypothetical protein
MFANNPVPLLFQEFFNSAVHGDTFLTEDLKYYALLTGG